MFGLSRKEHLKNLVKEDLEMWRLMCTALITTPSFGDDFPPSPKCHDLFEHRDWIFIGLVNCAFSFGFDTMRDWMDETLFQLEQIEKKDNRDLANKLDNVSSILNAITTDKSSGHEDRLEQAFTAIGARNVRCAVMWMFCNKFFKDLTTQKDPKLLLAGASHLYDFFYDMISTSKAMNFANKK